MDKDILEDLKEWRDDLNKNAEHRVTELDIAKINRAIDAIEHLRAEIGRLMAVDQSDTAGIDEGGFGPE
jgi:hypothetical protein